jgi:hypothetical protein
MRLVRHLSFSNVIAVIALFVALGGAAYAGSKINGNSIVNKSIGGGKLKNETITANKIKKGTITSAQIAPGSIDSTQINISTLTTVPSATTAGTATTATTAKTAETATKATSAVTADTAGEADEAKEADSAKHAKEADTAATATHATDADTLEGRTAESLTVGCPDVDTEFYGGMCWSKTTQPTVFWLVAVKECGDAGGRLPTIGELVAFVLRSGTQVSEQVWSGDIAETNGSVDVAWTSDETVRGKAEANNTFKHGYRCVFPLTN